MLKEIFGSDSEDDLDVECPPPPILRPIKAVSKIPPLTLDIHKKMFPVVYTVNMYYSELDDEGEFTFRQKTLPKDVPSIRKTIYQELNEYLNVHVNHLGRNVFRIGTDGPGPNSHIYNLGGGIREMGHRTPFVADFISTCTLLGPM